MIRERNPEFAEAEADFLGTGGPSAEQEAAARVISDEEREIQRIFLQQLMDNPMFRDWLYGLLIEFGTFENAIGVSPTGFPDPLATMFKQGVKSAGWRLWEIFDEIAPERASLMRRQGFKPS